METFKKFIKHAILCYDNNSKEKDFNFISLFISFNPLV